MLVFFVYRYALLFLFHIVTFKHLQREPKHIENDQHADSQNKTWPGYGMRIHYMCEWMRMNEWQWVWMCECVYFSMLIWKSYVNSISVKYWPNNNSVKYWNVLSTLHENKKNRFQNLKSSVFIIFIFVYRCYSHSFTEKTQTSSVSA